jgi:hypothetical protein
MYLTPKQEGKNNKKSKEKNISHTFRDEQPDAHAEKAQTEQSGDTFVCFFFFFFFSELFIPLFVIAKTESNLCIFFKKCVFWFCFFKKIKMACSLDVRPK